MPTQILRPVAIGAHNAWLGNPVTKAQDVDPGDPIAHDGIVGISAGSGEGGARQTFRFQDLPSSALTVNSVKFGVRWSNGDSQNNQIDLFTRREGVDATGLPFILTSGSPLTDNGPTTLPHPLGGAWTVTDVNNSEYGVLMVSTPATVQVFVDSLWLVVDFDDGLSPRELARQAGSRILRLHRMPTGLLKVVTGLEGLDLELMDDVNISHYAGPSVAGNGWGLREDERGLFRIVSRTPDPNQRTVAFLLRDLRKYLVTYWDTGHAQRSSSTTQADGVARISNGAIRDFRRASKAWIDDPGSRLIVELPTNDMEKLDYVGAQMERAATNLLLNSSAKDGIASNWTNVGTVAADTADLLFDATITPRSWRLTADTPLSTGAYIEQTTASVSGLATTRFVLSVDREDDSGVPTTYSFQRSIDSRWFQESDQSWQAAEIDNPMPIVTTKSPSSRFVSKVIDVGATAGTLKVRIKAKSGPGQINHVYHVQLEEGRWASSRILTQGTTVTRAAETLTVTNNVGRRTVHNDRGTFRGTFAPSWNAADLAGTALTMTLWKVSYGSGGHRRLYFDAASQQLRFEVNKSSVVYTASIAAGSLQRGVEYRVAARWTSEKRELGLAQYTASVFLQAVKGTDVETLGAPTGADTSTLELLCESGTAADVWWKYFEFVQFCMTDEEIARAPFL